MIKEMEEYAKENRVPIMLPDGIDYFPFIRSSKITTQNRTEIQTHYAD